MLASNRWHWYSTCQYKLPVLFSFSLVVIHQMINCTGKMITELLSIYKTGVQMLFKSVVIKGAV